MPLKNGHLTASERRFAEVMADTGDATYAGHKAGYKSSAGISLASRRPEVQAEIGKRVMEKLAGLGELAVKTVNDAMTSNTATWTNKLTAADMVLKRLERGEGTGGKEPSEMSADELQAAIRALQIRQAEIAEGAKDITPQPAESGVFD